MADKKLVIQAEAKVGASVQQLTKMLDDFAARGNKVARAFQGITGSGTGPGSTAAKEGGLAKSLLKEKKLFDDLGKSGEKLAKILNDQVGKSQTTLNKQFEESTKKLELLVKKHEFAQGRVEKLRAAGADPARIALAQRYEQRTLHSAMGGANELLGIQQAQGAMGGAGGAPGGGMVLGGLMQRAGSFLAGQSGIPGLGMLATAGPVGLGIAALVGATVAGYKTYISNIQAGVTSSAAMGSVQGQQFSELAQFDASQLMGRGVLSKGEGWEGISPRNQMAHFGNAALYLARRITGLSEANANAEVERRNLEGDIGRVTERAGQVGAVRSVEKQRLEAMSQAGVRRMEWRHGKGYADSIMSLGASNKWDMSATELAGYGDALAPYIGTRADPYSGVRSVANAIRQGMDPSQAVSIIGRTMVGGADVLGRLGGIDPTMRGILGDSVAGTMGAESMMFSGAGGALATAMRGGLTMGSGAGGVREAQQIVMGAGAYAQVFGGHDPFQKSYNIAAASAALGPNATPYARAFLAEQMRDPKVLASVLAGHVPADFANIGISKTAAQAMARDVDRGMVSGRWFDMAPGDDSKASQRMREMRKAGGPMQWLGHMPAKDRQQAIEEVAPLWTMTQHELLGGDVGRGKGMLMAAAGLGGLGGVRRGRKTGTGTGTPEEESALDIYDRTQNEAQSKINIGFQRSSTDLMGAAKDLREGAKVLRETLEIQRLQNRAISKPASK